MNKRWEQTRALKKVNIFVHSDLSLQIFQNLSLFPHFFVKFVFQMPLNVSFFCSRHPHCPYTAMYWQYLTAKVLNQASMSKKMYECYDEEKKTGLGRTCRR